MVSVGSHQSGSGKSLLASPFIVRWGVRKYQVIATIFFWVWWKANSRCPSIVLVLQFWDSKPVHLHRTILKTTLIAPCVIFKWESGRHESTPAFPTRGHGSTHIFHPTSCKDKYNPNSHIFSWFLSHSYYFASFCFLFSSYSLVISALKVPVLSLVITLHSERHWKSNCSSD